jgi:SAM-dependent methyltransferase
MKLIRDIRTLPDGRAFLNVGCGTRTRPDWNNLDRSPYGRLVRHPLLAAAIKRLGVLSTDRYERLQQVDRNLICHDARQGLPFPHETFDLVYSSHFLGVIEREEVPGLLAECLRVLKGGGVIRLVVGDLKLFARHYLDAVAALEAAGDGAERRHDDAVDRLFELMARRRPRGTSGQPLPVRALERLLRGNADDQGESLRWQYDEHSLGRLLREAGFEEVGPRQAAVSRVEGWKEFGLDVREDGSVYKPGSLYMEGVKPAGGPP